MKKFTMEQNLPKTSRAMGGDMTPEGQKVHYWQKGWVPLASRVNALRVLPSQYSTSDYTRYNTYFNAQFQSPPIAAWGSEYAFPSPNYYSGQYSYMNPIANTYPGSSLG